MNIRVLLMENEAKKHHILFASKIEDAIVKCVNHFLKFSDDRILIYNVLISITMLICDNDITPNKDYILLLFESNDYLLALVKRFLNNPGVKKNDDIETIKLVASLKELQNLLICYKVKTILFKDMGNYTDVLKGFVLARCLSKYYEQDGDFILPLPKYKDFVELYPARNGIVNEMTPLKHADRSSWTRNYNIDDIIALFKKTDNLKTLTDDQLVNIVRYFSDSEQALFNTEQRPAERLLMPGSIIWPLQPGSQDFQGMEMIIDVKYLTPEQTIPVCITDNFNHTKELLSGSLYFVTTANYDIGTKMPRNISSASPYVCGSWYMNETKVWMLDLYDARDCVIVKPESPLLGLAETRDKELEILLEAFLLLYRIPNNLKTQIR